MAANVALFLAEGLLSNSVPLQGWLGLNPASVVRSFWIWQLVTYMFMHGGLFHILFNMLALWMFGAELERIWGTRYFLKFYFACGVGAGVPTVLFSLLPFAAANSLWGSVVVGASGAILGLLLAYVMYFPDRQILMFMVFPMAVKYAVILIGAIALYSSFADTGGGVANITHLGGLVVGYLMLKGGRFHPLSELSTGISAGRCSGCARSSTSTRVADRAAAAATAGTAGCISPSTHGATEPRASEPAGRQKPP